MRAVLARRARSVRRAVGNALQDARSQVRADLASDPYLPYLLGLATVLTAFWVWHRLPNFATRDERWRVVDPVEALAQLAEELSYESLREGVTYWRSYGTTFYVSAVVLVPVLAVVVALGRFEAFTAMGRHQGLSFWAHWLATPGWIWTASVLPVRLATVAFAVGSVYLVYRIGTQVRDRATGRLAGLLFTLTWGFLVLSHEAGEDVPALFFFLLAFSLALAYVEAPTRRRFYGAALAGGVGAGMKLSAGLSAVVIGAAFVERVRREADSFLSGLVRPRLLVTGAGLGTAMILLGYPSVVVGDPAELGGRLLRTASSKTSPHGWRVEPSWWWIVRGYLHGLGLPLAVGAVAGVAASLTTLRERSVGAAGLRLALVATAVTLVVYSRWSYVRTHHLLLTFPLLVVVVAVMAMRLRDRRPRLARGLVALLLVTSGVYAVGGDLAYASQPRDRSAAYIADHAGPNATVETYVYDPQEAGVPRSVSISHPTNRTMTVDGVTYSPGLQQWTLAMPERCPDYIVLNYHQSLLYLAPPSWSARAASLSDRDLRTYYADLLAEETYPYEVARRFGRRPRFLDGQPRRPRWRGLLRVGVRPRTMQYGDPQDFGVDQYTVVLERTGDCRPSETSPLR